MKHPILPTLLLVAGVLSITACMKRENPNPPYEQSDTYLKSMHPIQERSKAKDWASISSTSGFLLALKKSGTLWYYGYLPWVELHAICGTDYIEDPSHSNRPIPAIELSRVEYGDRWERAYAKKDKLVAKTTSGQWLIVEQDLSDPYIHKVKRSEITKEKAFQIINRDQSTSIEAKIKADGTLWMRENKEGKPFKQETSYAKEWAKVSTGYSDSVIALKKDGTLWFWRSPKIEKRRKDNTVIYVDTEYNNTAYESQ